MFYLQNLKIKCDNLGRGVGALEEKCSSLSVTVDNLNVQLDKSLKNENILHDKLADLNSDVSAKDIKRVDTEEKNDKLQKALDRLKIEKQVGMSGRPEPKSKPILSDKLCGPYPCGRFFVTKN